MLSSFDLLHLRCGHFTMTLITIEKRSSEFNVSNKKCIAQGKIVFSRLKGSRIYRFAVKSNRHSLSAFGAEMLLPVHEYGVHIIYVFDCRFHRQAPPYFIRYRNTFSSKGSGSMFSHERSGSFSRMWRSIRSRFRMSSCRRSSRSPVSMTRINTRACSFVAS